jgi:spermidine synthase
MSYPVIYADHLKHVLALSEEEYSVYEFIRNFSTLDELKKKAASEKIDVIIESLREKGLFYASEQPGGSCLVWSHDPVDLLEKGFFSSIEKPARVFMGVSAFQKAEIFENQSFTYLKLNNNIQFLTEEDAFCSYAGVELPAALVGEPGEVLILGGGDGLVTRDVLKYSPRRITLVELDQSIVSLFRENAAARAICRDSLNHEKVNLVIGDAFNFVQTMEGCYDLIYADVELHATGQIVENISTHYFAMLSKCSEALSEEGIFVTIIPMDHTESVFMERQMIPLIRKFSAKVAVEMLHSSLEDQVELLFRHFFKEVKKVMVKMFFTDTHMVYYCSNRELMEHAIESLLRRNIPAERLGHTTHKP